MYEPSTVFTFVESSLLMCAFGLTEHCQGRYAESSTTQGKFCTYKLDLLVSYFIFSYERALNYLC